MANNLGQVPDYKRIKYYQEIVDKAKRDYLKHLISLEYVFEKQGSNSDTKYLAIHPDYYLTDDERWEKESTEGYISYNPEDYPEGAFININSLCVNDEKWSVCSSEFLEDEKCSIDYLNKG